MVDRIKALIDKDLPLVSNLANVSAVINEMPSLNWCGFYLMQNEKLYLGPFQGEVACTVIPLGRGVCGTAALNKASIIVPNVLEHPNHIACSSKSRSELVVPIIKNDIVYGVIDLDSPLFNRFTTEDQKIVEDIAKVLSELF